MHRCSWRSRNQHLTDGAGFGAAGVNFIVGRSQASESQMRLNGDLTPLPYQSGVHFWIPFSALALFPKCCCIPALPHMANYQPGGETSLGPLSWHYLRKSPVLGQVRAFHETWVLVEESWMEKMSDPWWRNHTWTSFVSGQQQIQSGPQQLLPWHQGIFWAKEKSALG